MAVRGGSSSGGGFCGGELAEEGLHPRLDLVPDRADRGEALPGRVGQGPVQAALAGEIGKCSRALPSDQVASTQTLPGSAFITEIVLLMASTPSYGGHDAAKNCSVCLASLAAIDCPGNRISAGTAYRAAMPASSLASSVAA